MGVVNHRGERLSLQVLCFVSIRPGTHYYYENFVSLRNLYYAKRLSNSRLVLSVCVRLCDLMSAACAAGAAGLCAPARAQHRLAEGPGGRGRAGTCALRHNYREQHQVRNITHVH